MAALLALAAGVCGALAAPETPSKPTSAAADGSQAASEQPAPAERPDPAAAKQKPDQPLSKPVSITPVKSDRMPPSKDPAATSSLPAGRRSAEPDDQAPARPARVATPSPAEIDGALGRGIDFLLKRQNRNGSWGSATQTKGLNIYAPTPSSHHAFRSGVTALCIMALDETRQQRSDAAQSQDRGEQWLLEHLGTLRRATGDALYNNWGHAYGIAALCKMLRRHQADSDRREAIVKLIEQQIDLLGRYECIDGGWAYYDFRAQTQRPSGSSISFVSATALVALHDAQQSGIAVPERLVKRAVDSLLRQRKPDFSYCYGEYLKYMPMLPVNRPAGSLGRSQACNVALRMWGDAAVTDDVLRTWLDRLFARNMWLDIGRKRPVPHEAWFQIAGYFFYYGHYYAALCIEQLPPEERGFYQDHLAQVLLKLQEKDGSWWDFPLYDYHQQYGTALAMMALSRCRHR